MDCDDLLRPSPQDLYLGNFNLQKSKISVPQTLKSLRLMRLKCFGNPIIKLQVNLIVQL